MSKYVYRGEVEPSTCIWCGSADISADDFDNIEGSSASRFVNCLHCGGDWVEVFFFGELISGEPPVVPLHVPKQLKIIASE